MRPFFPPDPYDYTTLAWNTATLAYVFLSPVIGIRLITWSWKRAFMWMGIFMVYIAGALLWVVAATYWTPEYW